MRERIQLFLATLLLIAGLEMMTNAAQAACVTVGCNCCDGNYGFLCPAGPCTEYRRRARRGLYDRNPGLHVRLPLRQQYMHSAINL